MARSQLFVEFTFRQWTLPMGAFGLRRTETVSGDKYRHIANG